MEICEDCQSNEAAMDILLGGPLDLSDATPGHCVLCDKPMA